MTINGDGTACLASTMAAATGTLVSWVMAAISTTNFFAGTGDNDNDNSSFHRGFPAVTNTQSLERTHPFIVPFPLSFSESHRGIPRNIGEAPWRMMGSQSWPRKVTMPDFRIFDTANWISFVIRNTPGDSWDQRCGRKIKRSFAKSQTLWVTAELT